MCDSKHGDLHVENQRTAPLTDWTCEDEASRLVEKRLGVTLSHDKLRHETPQTREHTQEKNAEWEFEGLMVWYHTDADKTRSAQF